MGMAFVAPRSTLEELLPLAFDPVPRVCLEDSGALLSLAPEDTPLRIEAFRAVFCFAYVLFWRLREWNAV
jgi:hypothetical protein